MKKGKQNELSNIPSEALAYAFGRTELWIEAYCKSHQLPEPEFRCRLATLLLSPESREVSGVEHSLPTLRGASAKVHQTVEPLALAKRSHSKPRGKSVSRTISAAGRARMRAAQRLRWKKFRAEKAGMKVVA